jgi:hypothetical protein
MTETVTTSPAPTGPCDILFLAPPAFVDAETDEP